MNRDEWKVNLPEGSSGSWRVEQFTVTPAQAEAEALRALFGGGRGVPAGTYTRLLLCDRVIMSDTPDEIRDHAPFVHRAEGRVLVHGLGLGMVASALLRKPEVTHVTVVEISAEVLRLVGPHLLIGGELDSSALNGPPGKGRVVLDRPRLRLVYGDAYTWAVSPKEPKWDYAWHDIWPTICSSNVDEMSRLHRRFGRRVGYQASWARGLCERLRDRGR